MGEGGEEFPGRQAAFAVTLATPWRELTGACGWPAEQYAENMSRFLRRTLTTGGQPGGHPGYRRV